MEIALHTMQTGAALLCPLTANGPTLLLGQNKCSCRLQRAVVIDLEKFPCTVHFQAFTIIQVMHLSVYVTVMKIDTSLPSYCKWTNIELKAEQMFRFIVQSRFVTRLKL